MYPTGILCLASYLEAHGHFCIIVDSQISPRCLATDQREEAIVAHVAELNPRVVCFSSTHREYAEVVRINRAIRKRCPGTVTIVGGAQPTYRYRDYLENGFNYVAIGEGEKTLCVFVDMVMSGKGQWEQINGLAWNFGGSAVVNPPRVLMTSAELSDASMPAYDKIDPRYFDYNLATIRGVPLRGAMILTTRGCPYDCSFCGCNKIFGRKIRSRSLASIARELEYLRGRGVEGLWIVDDTFTVNRFHALEVARLLKERGLIWGCQSRVDTVDDEMLAEFRACGCVQIDFGVESGSQRILDDVIHKGTTIGQIHKAFALAKRHGIRTLANIMIGLPSETPDDLVQTQQLVRDIGPDVVVVSIATPLPGTELYCMVGEVIKPEQFALLDWRGSELTSRLNKSEIVDIVEVHHALRRKYLWRSLLTALVNRKSLGWLMFKRDKLRRLNAVLSFAIHNWRPQAA